MKVIRPMHQHHWTSASTHRFVPTANLGLGSCTVPEWTLNSTLRVGTSPVGIFLFRTTSVKIVTPKNRSQRLDVSCQHILIFLMMHRFIMGPFVQLLTGAWKIKMNMPYVSRAYINNSIVAFPLCSSCFFIFFVCPLLEIVKEAFVDLFYKICTLNDHSYCRRGNEHFFI